LNNHVFHDRKISNTYQPSFRPDQKSCILYQLCISRFLAAAGMTAGRGAKFCGLVGNRPAMKIIHTFAWHLGRALHGRKGYEEGEAFLNWLAALDPEENTAGALPAARRPEKVMTALV
jgi:hypothetical protein